MKTLFVIFLLSAGFIFSACPSTTTTPPPYGSGNGSTTDTLLIVPPDTTLQIENPGPVIGNDTTAIAQ